MQLTCIAHCSAYGSSFARLQSRNRLKRQIIFDELYILAHAQVSYFFNWCHTRCPCFKNAIASSSFIIWKWNGGCPKGLWLSDLRTSNGERKRARWDVRKIGHWRSFSFLTRLADFSLAHFFSLLPELCHNFKTFPNNLSVQKKKTKNKAVKKCIFKNHCGNSSKLENCRTPIWRTVTEQW